MLVTPSAIVTDFIEERYWAQGTLGEDQFAIAPVPLMISSPVLESSDQVRLSPQVPSYVAASALVPKRLIPGNSKPKNPVSGAAPKTITATSNNEIAFLIAFLINITSVYKK